MKLRRIPVLFLALAVFGLAASASAAQSPVKRAPTLLWKSYPLNQRVAATSRPFRPPTLAIGASNGGSGIFLELTLLALLGGGMLALGAVLVKSGLGDVATEFAARRGRSVASGSEPEATKKVDPDLLVALRPASSTAADLEPELDEPTKEQANSSTPVLANPIEAEADSPREATTPPALPPIRGLRGPLLRPAEEPAEVETPEAAPEIEEPQLQTPLPFAAEPEEELEEPKQDEAEGVHLWQVPPLEEHTEVSLRSCEIKLWRGYFRCQLYAALHGSSAERGFAFSPYFRLRDQDAPDAKATAALLELLDQLKAEGWTLARDGGRWYSFTLERPL